MRQYLLIIFLFFFLQATAQTYKDKLLGDWKFYLGDKTSFEFLRLNADGTGIKCFGQTLNGKDTLFENHVTTLFITKWKVEKQKLVIESTNDLTYKINPEYKLAFIDNGKIELEGEHLVFSRYPSILNRKDFYRVVTYQKADNIPKDYGVNTAKCISLQRDLFLFKAIDSLTQLAEYKGFDDLIPNIVGCRTGFEFVQKYHDPPYTLVIPTSLKNRSFGFGNKDFYISFISEEGDKSETSIAIYYDFDNEMKEYYFSQIKNGKVKEDIIKVNNLDIYKSINWQDKYEGKVFLDNSIVVAYYTREEKLQAKLQKCITSFKYK
jgi:hypothetical protein